MVFGGIDEGSFFLGVGAPEDEDDGVGQGVDLADDAVSELFPAFASMGGGAAGFDCQYTV